MRHQLKFSAGVCLLLVTLASYAIQINVKSTSNSVSALGFSVNGSSYGGLGTSYSANDLPAGASYAFGIRVGGIFGTDIPCLTHDGARSVKLYEDTTAILDYNDVECTLKTVLTANN